MREQETSVPKTKKATFLTNPPPVFCSHLKTVGDDDCLFLRTLDYLLLLLLLPLDFVTGNQHCFCFILILLFNYTMHDLACSVALAAMQDVCFTFNLLHITYISFASQNFQSHSFALRTSSRGDRPKCSAADFVTIKLLSFNLRFNRCLTVTCGRPKENTELFRFF